MNQDPAHYGDEGHGAVASFKMDGKPKQIAVQPTVRRQNLSVGRCRFSTKEMPLP